MVSLELLGAWLHLPDKGCRIIGVIPSPFPHSIGFVLEGEALPTSLVTDLPQVDLIYRQDQDGVVYLSEIVEVIQP